MEGSASEASVVLTPVAIDRAAELATFCRSVYRQRYEYLWLEGGSEWYQRTTYNVEAIARELQDPQIAYYYIDVDKSHAGYLKINLGQNLPGLSGGLEISRVYLSTEFTGLGAGRRVLSQIASSAKAMDRRYLWLNVMDSSEAAIRFYLSNGFDVVGETMPSLRTHEAAVSTHATNAQDSARLGR